MYKSNKLSFWPWMKSENIGKAGVPIALLIISIINLCMGHVDLGYTFLYMLTVIACTVSFFGIKRHWKTLVDLDKKGQL